MTKTTRPGKRHRFGIIILVLVVATTSAIVLESAARMIAGVPLEEKLPLSRVVPDADIGWVMRPSDEHYTYEHPVKLNRLGFRDSEIREKQPHEYRILALGDSHLYGQGLGDKALMTTVLERALVKTGGSCRFNVINAGVRAYSTNNELALLRKVGPDLDPDHVIVFFYINDFIPVNIARRYRRFAHMDWYTFDFSAKPTEDLVAKWKRIQILRSSAFLMWVYDTYRSLTNRTSFINRMMHGDFDDNLRNNIQSTIASLEEIRGLSEAHGARFTVAVIPLAAQITRAFPDQVYQPTLERYAAKAGIDLVDLLPKLRSHHRQFQDPLVLPFDGHYNGLAHSLMASSVLDYLGSLDLCRE
jgi:lysophospholipase L1-like esterase